MSRSSLLPKTYQSCQVLAKAVCSRRYCAWDDRSKPWIYALIVQTHLLLFARRLVASDLSFELQADQVFCSINYDSSGAKDLKFIWISVKICLCFLLVYIFASLSSYAFIKFSWSILCSRLFLKSKKSMPWAWIEFLNCEFVMPFCFAIASILSFSSKGVTLKFKFFNSAHLQAYLW